MILAVEFILCMPGGPLKQVPSCFYMLFIGFMANKKYTCCTCLNIAFAINFVYA